MMRYRQIKRHPFVQPLCIVSSCFLQPTKFAREEPGNPSERPFRERLQAMWKLAFMLFLISYFLAIPIRLILRAFIPGAFPLDPSLAPPVLLLDIAWPIIIIACTCTLLGARYGRAFGITLALGGGIWAGVAIHTNIEAHGYLAILSTTLAMFGLISGITLASARDIKSENRASAAVGHLVGIVLGTPLGIFAGLLGGYLGGFLTYTTMRNGLHWSPDLIKIVDAGNIVGAITGFLTAGFLALAVDAAIQANIKARADRQTRVGVQRGLSTGWAFCLTGSVVVGGTISFYISYQTIPGTQVIQNSLTYIVLPNLPAALAAALVFMAGNYRLQLYPFSSLSSMIACWASRRNPPKVFKYLHRSALYWDECVFLRLPGLQEMLYIAVTQNPKIAWKEIQFVVKERPTQAGQVHQAMLELILRELETYEELDQMQKVATLLEPLLQPEAGYVNPAWVAPLIELSNASLEVQCYLIFFERASRIEALRRMIDHLKRVQPDTAFHNERQNNRLKDFVTKWKKQAEEALTILKNEPIEAGTINNPYRVGPALQTGDHLFVGRQDIIEALKKELGLDRSDAQEGFPALNKRSAFFLKGERRMGKTSTLNQLSNSLGTNCFAITLDLQSPSVRATLAGFLWEIAKKIYTTISTKIPHFTATVHKLDYRKLERVARENERQAYGIFEEWLAGVEAFLQKDKKKLLLAFDEFEKLNENRAAITIEWLLDWFRSMTENHPCLTLLFCGVKSPAEIGWASYFVHVKTLPVRFLLDNEARQLIIDPLINSELPGHDIFNDEVVSEIIRVTACHPFLLQAICSELIDILNIKRCKSASLQDVTTAIDNLLENWDSFFVDLWARTNEEQRSCLKVLATIGHATSLQITHQTQLGEEVVYQALKKLCERDLVTGSKGHLYSIITPIFTTWIMRRIMEAERG
ncbi:MAG TPA: hypothetical protein VKY19_00955 [Ktedonosporobacter sp.]|nr:hypothetical protein [Ktedonosporobacter sp.]